jgi:peptidoglycan/LPS O-acetylase OafA/YrhL
MYQKERFQNNYDFLRLFAAVCIMFTHSFDLLDKNKYELARVISNGRINFSFIGLSIFFSISGYLIAKSAERSSGIKNYLWKRILRIQPLLIVTCLLTVLVMGPAYTSLSIRDYLLNSNTWTYFRNILPVFGLQFTLPGVFLNDVAEPGVNGSLWTLIVEERLYLLVCIFFLFYRNRFMFLFSLIIPINILYLVNRFYFTSSVIPYLNSGAFFYALIFLNASALYFLRINFSKHLFGYIIVSVGMILIGMSFPSLSFIYFFSIPFLINSIAQVKGALNKTGKYGDFTYGIYVFAFPIQQMLISSKIATKPYQLFLYSIILVVPLAITSWHLIEKKSLKMKNLVS